MADKSLAETLASTVVKAIVVKKPTAIAGVKVAEGKPAETIKLGDLNG